MKANALNINLSENEVEACLAGQFLKVPDRTGIVRGARYSMSVKIGGKMELVSVMCKGTPRQRKLRDGKKVWVVDVFGFGISGPVWVTSLRERVDAMEVERG